MPRIDPLREAFKEQQPTQSRYIKSWSDLLMIFIPALLLPFAFWWQAPAGPARPAVATPKPPVPAAAVVPSPVTVKPGVPRVGEPAGGAVAPVKAAVSPVKAAAAKAVAVAPKPKAAVPGDPAVLTIGPERITKTQFEEILASLPDQLKGQFATPQGKREFAKQYAEMKSLALEARKKMGQDAKLRRQWELQIDQTLANLFMREAMSSLQVDEASMRKYYDEHKGEFENANGRHVLIRFKGSPVPLKPGQKELTEEEALAKVNDIKKRLAAGEDFVEMAKKESDDAGSGAAGGALGDFPRGMMVPAFDQAAFSLPVNQVSDPVKTQFGYHIIQIQSRKSKTFDEARSDIEKRQKPEMSKKVVDEIKSRNPVVMDEAYFGKD